MELAEFKQRIKPLLDQLPSIDELREDEHLDYIFETGKDLFENDLDQMNEGWLINKGANLAGTQIFLANKVANSRAKRDAYIQQRDEIVNKIMADDYGNSDSKITLSRAKAKSEVASIDKYIVILEYNLANMEGIKKACESMTSFIQSAIRSKTNERNIGDRLHG